MTIYQKITQEYVRERFDYNGSHLVWKKREIRNNYNYSWNTKFAGKRAGTLDKKEGYYRILLDKKIYAEHQLIWLWIKGTWPKEEIDHINRNRSDNRIENLREATKYENQQNRTLQHNSTSGYTGVCWHVRLEKWQARLTINNKRLHLGYFDDPEKAFAAYSEAKAKYHTFNPILV